MTEYDISLAFKRIEAELIRSIFDNLERHKAQETAEGLNWEMWQVKQLKALEKYRKENSKKFKGDFDVINKAIKELFKEADANGMDEADSLGDIIKGDYTNTEALNENRIDSLIKATTSDLKKAEQAVLRRANDRYRKIIFDAQAYANQGGTYEQAIDMATKDFLHQGIDSIVYKNGARHTISDYASMAIKTGAKRAYLMGFGKKMNELGVHTIRVNKRQGACPLCAQWIGRVMVDDVYSGGTAKEAKEKNLPLLSEAMAEGFLHPNCKDIYSIYIEGVSKPEKPPTRREIARIVDNYNQEQDERKARDNATRYKRMADYSMTEKQERHYRDLEEKWEKESKKIKVTVGHETLTVNKEEKAWIDDLYGTLEDKGFSATQQDGLVEILYNLPVDEGDSWVEEIEDTPYVFHYGNAYHSMGTAYINHISPASTVIHETMHRADYKWKVEYTKDINVYNSATHMWERKDTTKKIRWSAYVDLQCDPDKVYDEVVDFFDYDVRPRARDIKDSEENREKYRKYMRGLKDKYITLENYNDEFDAFLNARSSLSDILAGITTNGTGAEKEFGYHRTSDWESQPFFADGDFIFEYDLPSYCSREALAGYAEIRTTYPKLLEELKLIVPDYYELLEEAYEEVLGIR